MRVRTCLWEGSRAFQHPSQTEIPCTARAVMPRQNSPVWEKSQSLHLYPDFSMWKFSKHLISALPPAQWLSSQDTESAALPGRRRGAGTERHNGDGKRRAELPYVRKGWKEPRGDPAPHARSGQVAGTKRPFHRPCQSATAQILAANCSHQAAGQSSYLISHRRAPCSVHSSLIHLLVWITLQNSFKASLVPMQFCLDLIWLQKIIMSEPSLNALYIFLDSVLENTSVANLTSHWILLLFHANPLGIRFLWQ